MNDPHAWVYGEPAEREKGVRRAARVDGNQVVIVTALRRAGASVAVTSQLGQGFPDLVVGYCGRNYLLEVKQPNGKLTQEQRDFHREWQGQLHVVTTPEEALLVILGGSGLL